MGYWHDEVGHEEWLAQVAKKYGWDKPRPTHTHAVVLLEEYTAVDGHTRALWSCACGQQHSVHYTGCPGPVGCQCEQLKPAHTHSWVRHGDSRKNSYGKRLQSWRCSAAGCTAESTHHEEGCKDPSHRDRGEEFCL